MRSVFAIEREYQERHDFGMSDAHCHINLFDEPGDVIKEAFGSGVKTIVTAGGNSKDNLDVERITSMFEIFGVVGIGPDAADQEEGEIEGLRNLIKSSKKIVGLGEIGLDFKISGSQAEIDAQKRVFIKQIELAGELEIPIVIHARKAIADVLKIVIDNGVEKAMFHFFEGGIEEAKLIEKNDYLISIPPLPSSRRKKVIGTVEIGTLVTETDAPVAGSTPSDVKKSVAYIAEIKKMPVHEVARHTTDNLREFFYI